MNQKSVKINCDENIEIIKSDAPLICCKCLAVLTDQEIELQKMMKNSLNESSNDLRKSRNEIELPKLQEVLLISQNECEQTLDCESDQLNTQTIKSRPDNSPEREIDNMICTQCYYSCFVNKTRSPIKFDGSCFDVSLLYSLQIKQDN